MSQTFDQIAIKIIKEQELIIGPLAWTVAGKVSGLSVDRYSGKVDFTGDPRQIIDKLVAQYELLFGRASHEVCRHAVSAIISDLTAEQVPASLR